MNLSTKSDHSKKNQLLMIHADDAGLSHSENQATIKSVENGIVNSFSIMVPCPGFLEIATFAKSNPQYDYGIHLTLTCEWENQRFGPTLPVSEVPSLVDDNGHLYKQREELKRNANPLDVEKELQAQIEKALQFGLKPTHIDSHMYSVGVTYELFKIYKNLGKKYDLPVLINKDMIEMAGGNPELYIKKGDFIIDTIHLGKFEHFKRNELDIYYRSVFDHLSDSLNILILHPAIDDDEMKNITIDHPNFGSKWRQIDFDFATNEESKSKLKESNIELITWRDLTRIIHEYV